MEVEARAIGGGDGEVGQQRAVVEVHQSEETIIQTQAQEELQSRPGPGHPEGQEGQGKEGAIGWEGFEAPQHHLWVCDWRAWPGKRQRQVYNEEDVTGLRAVLFTFTSVTSERK